jgi:hypothetical protein
MEETTDYLLNSWFMCPMGTKTSIGAGMFSGIMVERHV